MQPLLYKATSTKEALAYQSTRPTHPIQEREPLLDKGTSTIQGNLYYTREPLLDKGTSTIQGNLYYAREALLYKGTFTIQGNLYYTSNLY